MDKNKQKQKPEAYKKFFIQKDIEDKQSGHTERSLGDIDISIAEYIEPRLYLVSKKENCIYIYEKDQIVDKFMPFSHQLYSVNKTQDYLIVYGSESSDQQYSFCKFYNTKELQQNLPVMKKSIQIGKNLPQKNCMSFSVLDDLSAIAFGFKDGSVILIKAKDIINYPLKETTFKASDQPIKQLFLSKQNNSYNNSDSIVNMFVCTDDNIECWIDCSKKKLLYQPGGHLFSLTGNGTLIGCCNNDSSNIIEFDYNKKINQFNFDEENAEKCQIKCFKENYVITLSFNNQDFMLTIFDFINGFIAYKQNFCQVQSIIPSQNLIHIMHMNVSGEKKITKLTEIEYTQKLQYFFNRFLYDVAYKFAKNQNQDQKQLAEISRLHADNIYQKGDYQQAVLKYIDTIGYVEPSQIVIKFLDVSQIEYLIMYLESLHQKKQNDQHYTALLLNCYVKQKTIDKLEAFIKQNSYDKELFDIDLAIKVCRESKNNDLALTLADQNKQSEQYLDILMETFEENNTLKAIDYLKKKVDLQEKTKYLLLFGQKMMKLCPEKTVELIQNMVLLACIGSSSSFMKDNIVTSADQVVLDYFALNQEQYQEIPLVTFRQPDQYFHLFLGNKEIYLQQYLEFLISIIDQIKNEKVIFYKLFEFYLERNDEESSNKIVEILKNNKYDKKYDQNNALVLFKMKKFAPGIIYIYQNLGLKEDLLDFYLNNNQGDKIIELCKKEVNEPAYWIQALKYFIQDERFKNKEDTEAKLKEILENIANQSSISPLLVLNIVQQSKNIKFSLVKSYFKKKLEEDYKAIQKDQEIINKNIIEVQKQKDEYQLIKTQAKIFNSSKCSDCETDLNNPRIHFMCGHSFHIECLACDKQHKECDKCGLQFKNVIERKEQFNQQKKDSKAYYENLAQQSNKFDVIAGFLGKGLFSSYK